MTKEILQVSGPRPIAYTTGASRILIVVMSVSSMSTLDPADIASEEEVRRRPETIALSTAAPPSGKPPPSFHRDNDSEDN